MGKNWVAFVLFFGLLCFGGCGKHDAGSGGDSSSADAGAAASGGGGPLSGTGDPAAVKFLCDELRKHWVATPDGFTSEYPSHVYIATGLRADAESFYRQIKELKFVVETQDLDNADKLNGITYEGYCKFQSSPTRKFNDPNELIGKHWTPWAQSNEEAVRVEKKNGQWSAHSNSYLVDGTQPTASTLAQLK